MCSEIFWYFILPLAYKYKNTRNFSNRNSNFTNNQPKKIRTDLSQFGSVQLKPFTFNNLTHFKIYSMILLKDMKYWNTEKLKCSITMMLLVLLFTDKFCPEKTFKRTDQWFYAFIYFNSYLIVFNVIKPHAFNNKTTTFLDSDTLRSAQRPPLKPCEALISV